MTMDMRYRTPLALTNMIGAEIVVRYRDDPNHADHMIEPGDRRESEIFLRITEQKEYLRMPPIGSRRVDPLVIELIGQWIDAGAR